MPVCRRGQSFRKSELPSSSHARTDSCFRSIIDDFGTRSWMPARPEHLDYANAQVLLIGEDLDGSAALEQGEQQKGDGADNTTGEEIYKLEDEDEKRIEHLHGNDSVFDDLGISHKEYSSVPTTWVS